MSTKKIDFSKQLFRCSSLGKLMTGNIGLSDTQKETLAKLVTKSTELTALQKETFDKLIKVRDSKELSKTCKTELIKIYNLVRFGRFENIENRYTKKGLEVEDEAIAMLTRLEFQTNGLLLKKNTVRVSNSWFTGEVDLFTGKSIKKADEVTDIKSKWDLLTFSKSFDEPMDSDHLYQLQGYMSLTSAKKARISSVLVDTPSHLVESEKNALKWKLGVIDPDENEMFQEACLEIERNHCFDDIPLSEREFSLYVDRDNDLIKEMKARVPLWRKFLMEYHAKRLNYAITRKWESIESIISDNE